ncbi:hypothetical protein BGW80DRAFT_306027 [Lactifluus volemus]|nr:hypothetical protein BGW80DRAFT_306027 [Lactifluus volemus]
MMSSSLPAGPTPLQSFLGGVGLALPAQALLSFNHSMFGISGFIHRAVRGNLDDFTSLLGLILAVSLLLSSRVAANLWCKIHPHST